MRTFFGSQPEPEIKKQSFEKQAQLQRADSEGSSLTAKTRRLDSFAVEPQEESSPCKGGASVREESEGEVGKPKGVEGEVKGGGEVGKPEGGEGEVKGGGEVEGSGEVGKSNGVEGEVAVEAEVPVEAKGDQSPLKPRNLESVFDAEATSRVSFFISILVSSKH